jgi:hypothetical protein
VLRLGMDADGEQRYCREKRGDSPEGVHGRSLTGDKDVPLRVGRHCGCFAPDRHG